MEPMSTTHELRVSHGQSRRLPRIKGEAARGSGKETSIAIFGCFGCGNLGNDGSLESMLLFLRKGRPDARLSCICRDPEVVTETFRIDAVPIRIARGDGIAGLLDRIFLKIPRKAADCFRAIRFMRKADVMIMPGTGMLGDFGDRPLGMPFDMFRWCLAARLVGTRIAFVNVGAGPIRHRVSRWLLTSAASMADYRSYRDAASRDFMESVGIDIGRDSIYPDLAFKLPVPQSPNPDPLRPLTVGVGVMRYRGWYGFEQSGDGIFEGYVAKVTMFVSYLLAQGYRVRLLTGDEDDRHAVAAILTALGDAAPQELSCEPVHSLHDVLSQVAQTDLVVATRFHNVVAALMAGKPVISLGYAEKNALLLGQMGLAEYCQHVEDFDVGLLIEQFQRLAAHREEHSRTIRDRVARMKDSLEVQDEFLLSTLLCAKSPEGLGAHRQEEVAGGEAFSNGHPDARLHATTSSSSHASRIMTAARMASGASTGGEGAALLTVAICTHNRGKDLVSCLNALFRQELAGVKVLVVDSASSERERARIAVATRDLPSVEVIRLDRPGIALARNAAAEAAATEWLGYVDDDIVVAPDWVGQAKRLIGSVPDTCAVIGGRVDPIFPEDAEPAIGFRWRQLLSLIQIDGEGDRTNNAQIVGGNALFRRTALLAAGAFPPQLGRVGNVLLSGEEKLAIERLRQGGARLHYSDRLRVGHKIPEARLHRKWAARRAYWDGVTDQKIRRLQGKSPSFRQLTKVIVSIPILALACPIRSPAQEFFLRFWYNVGFIRELIASVALEAGQPSATAARAGELRPRVRQI